MKHPAREWSSKVITPFVLWAMIQFGNTAHGGITGIVSFGDSLSDVGNFYAQTGGTLPPAALGYDQGRFSNGPNWVEYVARELGVAAPTASVNGGTDYAYGGALTGTGYASAPLFGMTFTVPNIGTQIDTYLASNTPNANQLFTIWGGANDFLNGGQTNPLIPAQNIATEIATLAHAGATQFLIPNLPPLGNLPITLTYPPAVQAGLNELSVAFNSILQAEAAQLEQNLGIQIQVLDVYSLTEDAIHNPSKYGLANVTTDAVQDNGGTNAQGYLFWDIVHPTSYVDSIIASAVPEPSSFVLVGTSAVVIAVWAGLRQRARGPSSWGRRSST